MDAVPTIFETARLSLRAPVLADAQAIFEGYAQDLEVTRYMTWSPHGSVEDSQQFLQRCLAVWAAQSAYPYVIELRREEISLPIGMIEMRILGHAMDLGYVLARPFWGQGYGTEAAKVLTQWALEQPEIYRVWAVCDVENPGSARVMQKVGMELEGVLRRYLVLPNVSDVPRDVYCYSLVK